jgi:Tfp pilus assembly protein PilF
MLHSSSPPLIRLMRVLALVLALALGVTACSGSSETDSKTVDAKAVETALEAGLTAHSAGDLDTATEQYNKVLDLDPSNKFAFYNLALIDSANHNDGLAEAKYRLALESDPAYTPALFNLALLREKAADHAEAMSLYKSAVAAEPDYAAAWLNLGLLQRTNGQRKLGNQSVLKAITLDPSLVDPEAK